MVKVRRRGSERSWIRARAEANSDILIEVANTVGIQRMKKLTRTCQTTRISKIQLNLHSKHVLYGINLTA